MINIKLRDNEKFYITLTGENNIEILGNMDGQGFNSNYKTLINLLKYYYNTGYLLKIKNFRKQELTYKFYKVNNSNIYEDVNYTLVHTLVI